jgi:hypothetical protein
VEETVTEVGLPKIEYDGTVRVSGFNAVRDLVVLTLQSYHYFV